MSFKEYIFDSSFSKDLEMTFNTYITLKSNKEALSKAQNITKKILLAFHTDNINKKSIAPLIITSNCGAGKTHLLQSIHSELKNLNVISTHAEGFLYYLQKGRLIDYCQTLKSGDILLIDDLHLLNGGLWANEIQQEANDSLIDLILYYYRQDKPIIATACFEQATFSYDEELKSIFNKLPFLTKHQVVIHTLDFEDRVTLLQQKRKEIDEYLLPDKKLMKVAKSHKNTHDIIEFIRRLLAKQRLENIQSP